MVKLAFMVALMMLVGCSVALADDTPADKLLERWETACQIATDARISAVQAEIKRLSNSREKIDNRRELMKAARAELKALKGGRTVRPQLPYQMMDGMIGMPIDREAKVVERVSDTSAIVVIEEVTGSEGVIGIERGQLPPRRRRVPKVFTEKYKYLLMSDQDLSRVVPGDDIQLPECVSVHQTENQRMPTIRPFYADAADANIKAAKP